MKKINPENYKLKKNRIPILITKFGEKDFHVEIPDSYENFNEDYSKIKLSDINFEDVEYHLRLKSKHSNEMYFKYKKKKHAKIIAKEVKSQIRNSRVYYCK